MAAHSAGSADRYTTLTARTLLLGGTRSPAFLHDGLAALGRTIPRATVELLDGLDHNAPDERAPERVAQAALAFLSDT
jgi:pimeloyl-ACP methyl ester carboxylesterase